MGSRALLPAVCLLAGFLGPTIGGEAAAVTSTFPADGASDVALDAAIEVRWDRPPQPGDDRKPLRLITLAGEEVSGHLVGRGRRAVLRPEGGLAPREFYELVVADGDGTTSVFFESGSPTPVLPAPTAATTGSEVTLSVRHPGAGGAWRYRWRPGDGSGWQEGAAEPVFTWEYEEPGHYLVQVEAVRGEDRRIATTGLTVHPPLGDVRPQASSPIVYDAARRLGGPLDGFDTPTLKGVWETPPYLHDGSAPDLAATFDRTRGDSAHGAVAGLERSELADLLAFLRQIDEDEPGFEAPPAVRLEATDGPAAFRVETGDLLGDVERVELLRATGDGAEVITAVDGPGRLSWDDAPPGTHRVHARVAFAGGVVTTTAPVPCTVEP